MLDAYNIIMTSTDKVKITEAIKAISQDCDEFSKHLNSMISLLIYSHIVPRSPPA